MIKNELIKFFTPLKISIYGGFILTFILISDVIFADKPVKVQTLDGFLNDNMKMLIFVIPLILAAIISEIFTYDYESGCMKFFIIYKKRENIFFSKAFAATIITALLIIVTFIILILVYTIQNPNQINASEIQASLILKTMVIFLITLLPILLIYMLISILCKSSTIISVLTFLLVIMSDFFPKSVGDITPRRFFMIFLLKNKQIDKFSVILFLL
ncbi:MAG: hypothetical protein F8N39_10600, partial [Clostridiaceae bacterium]|nr:hypothetical protein [Clostridiaceae bacterium]